MSSTYLDTMAKDINHYSDIISDFENEQDNDYWRITEYNDKRLNIRYEVTKKNGEVVEIRIMK